MCSFPTHELTPGSDGFVRLTKMSSSPDGSDCVPSSTDSSRSGLQDMFIRKGRHSLHGTHERQTSVSGDWSGPFTM